MFHKTTVAVTAIAALLAVSNAAAQDDQLAKQQAALAEEAKGIVKQFSTNLLAELKAGMESGGPIGAISACNLKAPVVAAKASADSGWDVGRSSHKLRNPGNAPDAFEARAIAEFQARQAKGEKAADIGMSMVTIENGKKVFRFAKAIPTGQPCLACHGESIAPEVAAKLDGLYPADAARGFKEGEMRGIFTLRKEM